MIIQLETENEIYLCDYMNMLYNEAIEGKVSARNFIKKCYSDYNWQTIKERMETEGSVWYVWYMDGIRKMMSMNQSLI